MRLSFFLLCCVSLTDFIRCGSEWDISDWYSTMKSQGAFNKELTTKQRTTKHRIEEMLKESKVSGKKKMVSDETLKSYEAIFDVADFKDETELDEDEEEETEEELEERGQEEEEEEGEREGEREEQATVSPKVNSSKDALEEISEQMEEIVQENANSELKNETDSQRKDILTDPFLNSTGLNESGHQNIHILNSLKYHPNKCYFNNISSNFDVFYSYGRHVKNSVSRSNAESNGMSTFKNISAKISKKRTQREYEITTRCFLKCWLSFARNTCIPQFNWIAVNVTDNGVEREEFLRFPLKKTDLGSEQKVISDEHVKMADTDKGKLLVKDKNDLTDTSASKDEKKGVKDIIMVPGSEKDIGLNMSVDKAENKTKSDTSRDKDLTGIGENKIGDTKDISENKDEKKEMEEIINLNKDLIGTSKKKMGDTTDSPENKNKKRLTEDTIKVATTEKDISLNNSAKQAENKTKSDTSRDKDLTSLSENKISDTKDISENKDEKKRTEEIIKGQTIEKVIGLNNSADQNENGNSDPNRNKDFTVSDEDKKDAVTDTVINKDEEADGMIKVPIIEKDDINNLADQNEYDTKFDHDHNEDVTVTDEVARKNTDLKDRLHIERRDWFKSTERVFEKLLNLKQSKSKEDLSVDKVTKIIDEKSKEQQIKIQTLELSISKLENRLLKEQLSKTNDSSSIVRLENQILHLENELIKINQTYTELRYENEQFKKSQRRYLELSHGLEKNATKESENYTWLIGQHKTKLTELTYLFRNQSELISKYKLQLEQVEDQNRMLYYIVMNQSLLISQVMKKIQILSDHIQESQKKKQETMGLMTPTELIKHLENVVTSNNRKSIRKSKRAPEKKQNAAKESLLCHRYETYMKKTSLKSDVTVEQKGQVNRGLVKGGLPESATVDILGHKAKDQGENTPKKEELVSKTKIVDKNMRSETKLVDTKMESEVKKVDTKIESETKKVDTKIESETKKVDTKIESETNKVDTKIESETKKVDTKIESETKKADTKIESETKKADTKIESETKKADTKIESETKKADTKIESETKKVDTKIESETKKADTKMESQTKSKESPMSQQKTKETQKDDKLNDKNLNKEVKTKTDEISTKKPKGADHVSKEKISPDSKTVKASKTVNKTEKVVHARKKPLYKDPGSKEPKDCYEYFQQGNSRSGAYKIKPAGFNKTIEVFCDMKNGGWTVIQRRQAGTTNFFRDWSMYKKGFGGVYVEHWLGNDIIHHLTNQKECKLRIDLTDWDKKKVSAYYDYFMVDHESEGYLLHVEGFTGEGGDSFSKHNLNKFSTKDVDNDRVTKQFGGSCANRFSGAWWYHKCYSSNLNGLFYRNGIVAEKKFDGIAWKSWKGPNYSMMKTEMKIAPTSSDAR